MTLVSGDNGGGRKGRYTFIDRYATTAARLIEEGEFCITYTHLCVETWGNPVSPELKEECQRCLPQIRKRLEALGYTVNLVNKNFDPQNPPTHAEARSVLPMGRGNKSDALHIPPPTPGEDDPIFVARGKHNFSSAIGKADKEITRIGIAQQREVMAPRVMSFNEARRIVWQTVARLRELGPSI